MAEVSSGGQPPAGLVAGKYRLTRLLGQGGMGAVWEGVHVSLGTRVAVKFIDAAHAGSEDLRQRFVNEAKAAAKLRSKHVVQVYDQGVTPDGRPYIVMEFLAGEPLDARLKRVGRLTIAEAASVLLQVARALGRAHGEGIIHRDLKPENVFLVWDEEDHRDVVKVVDFGIAKFTQAEPSGPSSSTRTGAVLGTPHYMSPEQARGLRSVDHRTDTWALGVIGYRAVVGKLPFDGEAIGDLLVKICTTDPPRPSHVQAELPKEFDAWISRALAREPDARFQSAVELADALCALAGIEVGAKRAVASARAQLPSDASGELAARSGQVTAVPLSTTVGGQKPSRTSLWVGSGLVGLLVLLGGAFGARAFLGDENPQSASDNAAKEPPAPQSASNAQAAPIDPAPSEPIIVPAEEASDEPEPPAEDPPPPAAASNAARVPGTAAARAVARAPRPRPGTPSAVPAKAEEPPRPKPPAPKPPAVDLGY